VVFDQREREKESSMHEVIGAVGSDHEERRSLMTVRSREGVRRISEKPFGSLDIRKSRER
jgi:hypothetical protein